MKNTHKFLHSHVTPHFRWEEFLYLPSWDIFAHPRTDEVQDNLLVVADKMEQIRNILGGAAISVSSGYRPWKYNEYIGGSLRSKHTVGMACDFKHSLYTADEVRKRLKSHLDKLHIRMEDVPGSSWTHIDIGPVINSRFFKP